MAHIIAPRVRETSTTTGTSNFTLAGAMFGSLAFGDVMSNGDTCDYVAQYGDTFEEGIGTYQSGVLQRTTVIKSLHANGTINTNKVSFAAGPKTIIMHFGSARLKAFYQETEYVLYSAQSPSSGQRNQLQANIGRLPAEAGTRIVLQQNAAPTGWSVVTTHNDKALRVVSGTPGSGGVHAFSSAFSYRTSDNTTITIDTMPHHAHSGGVTDVADHVHAYTRTNIQNQNRGDSGTPVDVNRGAGDTGTTPSGAHLHGVYGEGGGLAHNHTYDMRVQYVDVKIFEKS